MENNIFEGAKFGDKFQTRDGRKAIVVDVSPTLVSMYIERAEHKVWGEFNYPIAGNGILNAFGLYFYDNKDIDIVLKCEHTIKAFANGATNKEIRDLLSQYPDDAMVAVECCDVRTMKYNKEDNSIRID